MITLYEALFFVLKRLFSTLNRFTFRDFSAVNAANTLSALVSASLYFTTRSFFAENRGCGLCSVEGRTKYAVFLLIAGVLFNLYFFEFRQLRFREQDKQMQAFAFPAAILLAVWGSVVLYKIGVSIH